MNTIELKQLIKISKSGLTSYKLKKADSGSDEINVIGIKDIQNGRINIGNVDVVNMDKEDIRNKDRVQTKDLILSIRGAEFKAAVADESVDGYLLSNNLIALTLSDKIKPEVVAAYLNNPVGQRELHKRAGGSVMSTLNKKRLEEVPIPLISPEDQDKIVKFVQISRDYREALEKERELWDQMVESYIVEKMEV